MDAHYFEPVQRFEFRVICSILGVLVTARTRGFAVAGDEIFVFTVSLGRVSCNSLI